MGSSFSSSVTRIYSDIFAGTHCGVRGGGGKSHKRPPSASRGDPRSALTVPPPPCFPQDALGPRSPPRPRRTQAPRRRLPGPGETSPRPGAGPSRRGRAEGSPRALQRPACRQPRTEGTPERSLPLTGHEGSGVSGSPVPRTAPPPSAAAAQNGGRGPPQRPGRAAGRTTRSSGGAEEGERNSAAGARLAAGSATGPGLRLRSAPSEAADNGAGAAVANGEGAAAGTAAPPARHRWYGPGRACVARGATGRGGGRLTAPSQPP